MGDWPLPAVGPFEKRIKYDLARTWSQGLIRLGHEAPVTTFKFAAHVSRANWVCLSQATACTRFKVLTPLSCKQGDPPTARPGGSSCMV